MKNPEGAEACQGCGLIFAKWFERHPGSSPDPSSIAQRATEEVSTEGEAAPDKPQAAESYAERLKRPLPEREYHEFPVKKFAIVFGVLILGVGIYAFWPSAPSDYLTAKPIPVPHSIAGSAYEGTVVPTDTPLPCGYPENTCTPTPIATPMTITGPAWVYHGKVLDCLHLNPLSGVNIVFYNNGVGVTAVTDARGLYQISVPPLSGLEAYEVRLTGSGFRDGYWTDDPSGLSEGDRLARAYQEPQNQQFRGQAGGGGDTTLDFNMFPAQLTEQEEMQLRNARPGQ